MVDPIEGAGDSQPRKAVPERSLRRVRHPLFIAITCVLVVLALVGSFLAGLSFRDSTRDVVEGARQPVVVTAAVERRAVNARPTLSGSVAAGNTASLNMLVFPERPVITRQGKNPGESVASGDLLSIVAGTPVFGLSGPLPLYRDLRLGDRGEDVAALQAALASAGHKLNASGVVDATTVNVVHAMFEREQTQLSEEPLPAADGEEPKMTHVIPMRAFSPMPPGESFRVVASAAPGTVLSAEQPIVTIQTSPDAVRVRADPRSAAAIQQGAKATVTAGDRSFEATVANVGDFREAEGGQLPGHDVTFQLDEEAVAELGVGSQVIVALAGETAESLAVPAVAIKEDGQGTYVRQQIGTDTSATFLDVRVTVTVIGEGWAAIETEKLNPGDLVVVS